MFPVVTSHYATSILSLLDKHGIDTHSIILETGLPTTLSQHGSSFLPLSTVEKLITETFSCKGLRGGSDIIQMVVRNHIVPNLLQDAPLGLTVGESLQWALNNIKIQIPDADVRLQSTSHGVYFHRVRPVINIDTFMWTEVFTLWVMIELMRETLGNRHWHPSVARIQSNNDTHIYHCFDTSIQFYHSQSSSGLWFPLELLAQPSRSNANQQWQANKLENEISGGSISQIFSALRPYVLELDFNLDRAADIANIKKRTLQRRLYQHGLTFRGLRDNLIADIALEQLQNGSSVSHVAMNLGYASISQFSRAFKRITGIAPSKVTSAY
ncbi:helix-turn-helix domain-containing protein [Vibrio astriarenae]